MGGRRAFSNHIKMPRLLTLALLLGLGGGTAAAVPPHPDAGSCASALAALEAELAAARPRHTSARSPTSSPPSSSSSPSAPPLLFHLHVPRTAGRTLHACLLTPAVPPADRCGRAYGHGGGLAALNSTTPCRLLASHDDAGLLSAAARLPPAATLVTVRDPVARILSAYEFAVEGAALRLRGEREGERAAPHRGRRRRRRRWSRDATTPPTPVDLVWPWSTLIPWLAEDMRAHGGSPMPLAAFLAAPEVRDTLHEGAALQALGATSAGTVPAAAGAAAAVRAACAGPGRAPGAAAVLAAAATGRLRAAAHVGLAEEVDASVAAAAGALGWDLGAPPPGRNRTLGQVFRECEARTAGRAASRRAAAAAALGGAGPLEGQFPGGRAGVPAELVDAIRGANAADLAVYEAAKGMLADRLAGLGPAVARLPAKRAGQQQKKTGQEVGSVRAEL